MGPYGPKTIRSMNAAENSASDSFLKNQTSVNSSIFRIVTLVKESGDSSTSSDEGSEDEGGSKRPNRPSGSRPGALRNGANSAKTPSELASALDTTEKKKAEVRNRALARFGRPLPLALNTRRLAHQQVSRPIHRVSQNQNCLQRKRMNA